MKYSYEYKKSAWNCTAKENGQKHQTEVKEKRFHDTVRIWVRTEDACGQALRHKNQNKVWAAEEKYELIAKILAGASCRKRQFRLESMRVSCTNGSDAIK